MSDDRNFEPGTRAQIDVHNPRHTGALGGKARAARMTPEQRSAAARMALKARWPKLRATHEGVMALGPIQLECAVLEDGRHVVSERAFTRALGRARPGGQTFRRRGGDQLPIYLALKNLKPVIPEGFTVATYPYRRKDGGSAIGVDAMLIPTICGIWNDARNQGVLRSSQLPTARAADLIVRGFARVGIIALIDEVTGYQADRERDDLQKILKAYVCAEMLPWLQRFPSEFFEEIFRIMRWEYDKDSAARPGFVGKIINEWIYKRLPKPVLPALQTVNPVVNGHRRRKHHQYLTPDTGIPHLDRQISAVTVLMRASTDRRMFEDLLIRAFPVAGDQMPLGTATTTHASEGSC